jgi:hypothetical protein
MDLNIVLCADDPLQLGIFKSDRITHRTSIYFSTVKIRVKRFDKAIMSLYHYQNLINLKIRRFSSPTWYQRFAIFSNKRRGRRRSKRNTLGTSESLQVLIKWRVDEDCLTLILFWFGDWFTLKGRPGNIPQWRMAVEECTCSQTNKV